MACGGGKERIGGDGRDNDQIDFGGFYPRLLHGILRSIGCHVARVLTVGSDSSLFDSRARRDPFIARLNHFFEISVGEDPLGDIAAGSNDGNGAARLAGPRPRDFLHCSA
jgi:hypothetical protein